MVSKKTKKWAPLASFVNVERFLDDARSLPTRRAARC